MSQFNFRVKDYRIIKEASVTPEGICLLYGKNGHGKSSLIKSLVTLLSNKHSEDNFRHGEDSYSISATVDENTITYSRSGSNAQVQYNDETPKTKLGKGTLAEVEPRFPLRRIDFEDCSFYPSFLFQNSTLFNEVDPTELFSAMFSDIGKLSSRITQLKKDITSTSKLKNDSQVGSDMLKEKVSEANRNVDKIKVENPDLEERYIYLRGLTVKYNNYLKFKSEYDELTSQCVDSDKRILVSFYSEAQPLFSDLVFVEKVKSTLAQLENAKVNLGKWAVDYNALQQTFPVDVVSLVVGVDQIQTYQSQLESVCKTIKQIPVVSSGLIESVLSFLNIKKTLDGIISNIRDIPGVSCSLVSGVSGLLKLHREYKDVKSSLIEVNHSYDSVMKILKEFPCDRLVNGVCPYQEQIKM